MEILNEIGAFYVNNPIVRLFVAPTVMILIAYFIFKKRRELSYHAIQNTSATMRERSSGGSKTLPSSALKYFAMESRTSSPTWSA